jgi:NAD(P)H-binding
MEFTIIRPGGLKSEPATGQGVLTEDAKICGAVHREDVAQLVVQALFSDRAANKVKLLSTRLPPCVTGCPAQSIGNSSNVGKVGMCCTCRAHTW